MVTWMLSISVVALDKNWERNVRIVAANADYFAGIGFHE